jgi:hypothetical protein
MFNGTYWNSFRRFGDFGIAGRITPGHDDLGHFAGGLVDHLVAEHDRTARLHRGGVRVGLDDPHGT